MSDFTPEQVERAAEELWLAQDSRRTGWPLVVRWDSLSEATRIIYREDALAVLSAAGAPDKPAPAVAEAALEKTLREVAALAAKRALEMYLRGESK